MMPQPPSSLYIHIPFCRSKCAYCDFNSYPGLESLYTPYVEALELEMAQYSALTPDLTMRTIYLGGGTPTVLPAELLTRLLSACQRHFHVLSDAEITLEANPESVSVAGLAALRERGVNRLSLGVQSLDDALLRLLGRAHSAQQAVEAHRMARQAGLENVNLDLMYGLPGQEIAQWQQTLEEALSLHPDHLSLYALTLHDETPLARRIASGALPAPDDDGAADMYEWALETLERHGYLHYEISNWAGPSEAGSRLCQHNLTYWLDEPYLGIGAGAHSYVRARRRWNVAHPEEYIRLLRAGKDAVAGQEEIDRATEMSEMMMLGLRLTEGVTYERFRARFGCDLRDVYGGELADLAKLGLLSVEEEGIRMTRRGYLLGNEVFCRFV